MGTRIAFAMRMIGGSSARAQLALVSVSLLGAACSNTNAGGAPSAGTGGVMSTSTGGAVNANTGGTTSPGTPDGAAGTPLSLFDRVIRTDYPRKQLVECGADGQCEGGVTCFRLTDDIALCDAPEPVEATSCPMPPFGDGGPSNECGCGARTCGANQVCVAGVERCSCQGITTNRCADTACRSPADCPSGTVCRPSSFIFGGAASNVEPTLYGTERCVPAFCHSDAECTLLPNGRCGVVVNDPAQAGDTYLSHVVCLYPLVGTTCPPGTGYAGYVETGKALCWES